MLTFPLQKLLVTSCVAACLWAATTPTAHALAETDALGPDKALHYSISVGLTLGGSFVFDVIGFEERAVEPLSIGFALGMGLGKELFDAVRGSGFSAADLTWDVLGIATGLFIRVLLRELLARDAPDDRRDHFFFVK